MRDRSARQYAGYRRWKDLETGVTWLERSYVLQDGTVTVDPAEVVPVGHEHDLVQPRA